MEEWVNGWIEVWVEGWVDGWSTAGWKVERWMEEWEDNRMCGGIRGVIGEHLDGQMDG